MWTLHTDSGNSLYGGQYAKNIYLGDTRIVTKLNSGKDPTYQEESQKQYYYHSDHLGSASLISDYNGKEYQRIEYTPYGETWVEKTSNTGNEFLPYKFTGKEIDEETGLYYYGARYLDPKYSLWISADPALGDYIPGVGKATANDIGKLPGMGGAFNHINFNLYHYAGNNPVKYTDPDGNFYYTKNGQKSSNSHVTTQVYIFRLSDGVGNEFNSTRMILKNGECVYIDRVGANCASYYEDGTKNFTKPDGKYFYTFDGLTLNSDGTYSSGKFKNVIRTKTVDSNISKEKRNAINKTPGDFYDHANQFANADEPYNSNETPGSAGCTIGIGGQDTQDEYMKKLLENIDNSPQEIILTIISVNNLVTQ